MGRKTEVTLKPEVPGRRQMMESFGTESNNIESRDLDIMISDLNDADAIIRQLEEENKNFCSKLAERCKKFR
ncbi:hypothetical protein K3495_g4156 [Podosphaera aphanis]|nr:hypothetical protein K3495_g4156 [Podosphaera aphanis]